MAEVGVSLPSNVVADWPHMVMLGCDSTLRCAASDESPEHDRAELELLPGAASAIKRLNRARIPVVVIAKQGCFDDREAASVGATAVRTRVAELLADSGAWIDAWYTCPEAGDERDCRNPGVGFPERLLAEFAADPARVVFFGGCEADMAAAAKAGVSGVAINASDGAFRDLPSAVDALLVHTQRNQRRWWWGVWSWSVVLAAVLLGPALAPGYVLNLDMVFTPHQPLLPWMFGLDGGLPRAVPQDVIVGLLAGPVSGALLQKVVLLAALTLAGVGVARLLRRYGLPIALMAVTLYVWNAFVLERLLMGNWALLLSYAATPWLLAAVVAVRRRRASGAQVIGWAALGSWVPTGGVLMLVIALALLLPGSSAGWRRRWMAFGGVLGLNLTWILAALSHPAGLESDSTAAQVFAVHSDGPWGVIISALSLGGTWNSDVVPASRGFGLGVVWLAVVGALAVAGLPLLRRLLTPWVFSYVTAMVVVGALLAVLSASVFGTWIVGSVPGGGLLRDGQKPLAVAALWLSLAASLGMVRVLRAISSREYRRVVLAVAVVLPIVLLPDAAWAGGGRLAARDYPTSWFELKEQLGAGDAAVVSLPWSTFRRYKWNDDRTVVDPLPRFVDRTVVGSDELLVGTGRDSDGSADVTVIKGDSPRAAAVAAAMSAGTPLATALPPLGIGYAVVQTDQPIGRLAADLTSMTRVWEEDGLELWVTPSAPVPWVSQVSRASVIAGYVAAIVSLIVAIGVYVFGRWRTHSRKIPKIGPL